ncbi:MAG TPA: DUF4382 domain-containing protein [Prolixibacteraceae bacterium]|jgi:hypothetical protein
MKTLKYFILAAAVSTLWVGCNKDDSSQTTRVKVRMTDAPGNYQQVNVDVTGVEFIMSSGTVNLNVTAGVYNLLDFVNGLDTLIASADVESGTLSQVRLILGDNNSVMVNGVVYHLTTPSAQQSGLKLSTNAALSPGVDYELLLDFDASKSIVTTGNGEYQLKPVVRAISEATTGSVHGSISTLLALPATVSVTNGTATYTTTTDAEGRFLVRGLTAGTYSVTVTPTLPYLPVTIANVNVTVGAMTEMPVLGF